MREIKFRAWCDFKKVMIPNYCILNLDKQFEAFDLTNNVHGITNVMQYTGLKDKNGIEIYKGDILQTCTEKAMVVSWSNKYASFVLNREGWAFSHWFGESCDPEDCIIIGNVHQNPELLKES